MQSGQAFDTAHSHTSAQMEEGPAPDRILQELPAQRKERLRKDAESTQEAKIAELLPACKYSVALSKAALAQAPFFCRETKRGHQGNGKAV